MKKNKIIKIFLGYLFFISTQSVYAVMEMDPYEQAQENTWVASSFFTTEFFINFAFALWVIILSFFISKIASIKITSYMERTFQGSGTNREELIWVITRVSNITILMIWFSITLTILGIDMGIFLGGLGLGIGFTLKVFLSNFISGIVMVVQWFYHNGDVVEVEDRIGKIIKIHSLFTIIEQFDGIRYLVPNIKFLEWAVSNYNSNDKRRVDVEVWVDYETDIIKAKQIISQVIQQFPNILENPGYQVVIDKLDNSSINLVIRFWISSKDSYFMMKSNITETVNLAFQKSGISIPFPQIVVSNRKQS